MAGSWGAGVREVWAHPWRIVRAASLTIGAAAPDPISAVRTPSVAERALSTRDGAGCERWTTAAAHAAGIWDVSAPADAPIAATWLADCSAAGESGPPLRVERIDGGLRVTRGDGPGAEFILARGDALEADGLRIAARGRGALRIVILAGADAADLARARGRIERRGLAAIAGEREQHSRLIADFGTAIESSAADEVAEFEWAKAGADGLLVELGGGYRGFAADYRLPETAAWERFGPVVWASGDTLASLGAALLAAGLREPVRDVIRSGGAPELATAWQAWTGETAPAAAAPSGAVPRPAVLAERAAPEAFRGPEVWAPITRAILDGWNARPEGGARLAIRPTLPDGRSEMAIRRLRVGASVVDAELRRRFDRVLARLYRRHGPALPITVELGGPPPVAVTADDEPLAGARAVVAVSDRHEVLFQF